MKYQIYQLKIPENIHVQFRDYASIKIMGWHLHIHEYRCVHEGEVPGKIDLDALYTQFNGELPSDFKGRSLSVGDIIVTQDHKDVHAFFVDSVGFRELNAAEIGLRLDEDGRVVDELRIVPLYQHTFAYASGFDEIEAYRLSRKENIRCKNAIDRTISQHFDGFYLDVTCIRPLIDEYGPDRMEWVLANTVKMKSYDGRFSRKNKDWANTIPVPLENDGFGGVKNSAFESNAHPAVLNGFINEARTEIRIVREEMAEKEMERRRIDVLVVEPGKAPYEKRIAPDLKSLQNEVGGYIEATYPFPDSVAILCDDEGKLNGKTANRSLRNEYDQVFDVVCGTFLVAGVEDDHFCSLNEDQMQKYKETFKSPEIFMRFGDHIVPVPVEVAKRTSVRDALRDKQETVRNQETEKQPAIKRESREALE